MTQTDITKASCFLDSVLSKSRPTFLHLLHVHKYLDLAKVADGKGQKRNGARYALVFLENKRDYTQSKKRFKSCMEMRASYDIA